MRALIREYLASLRERDELDAVLPDMLSELGYTVFSRPSRGTRQMGVDVAATGPPGDGRVYLFSLKSGDLTRSEWNGTGDQALRPSLDEILDAYVPHQLPPEHAGRPVVICPCFGGEVRETVREQFHGYMGQRTKPGISFEVWNGDRLARHLEEGVLGDRFMTDAARSHVRKAIVTSDEPDVSFRHFGDYLLAVAGTAVETDEAVRLSTARQVSIALWMLFVWSRQAGNLESAYLSSELALLRVWDLGREVLARNDRSSEPFGTVLSELVDLHLRIWDELVGRKALPHAGSLHALSAAVRTASPLDVNLKLFDLLGRVALRGLWELWIDARGGSLSPVRGRARGKAADHVAERLCAMVACNTALMSPIADEQVTDLALAFTFLAAHGRRWVDLRAWITEMVRRIGFSYASRGSYPCIYSDYPALAEHPGDTEGYFERATAGSVLLPTLAFWSAGVGAVEALDAIASLAEGLLAHCAMQFWLPGNDSEPLLWRSPDGHGAAFLDIPLAREARAVLDYTLRECGPDRPFEKLSAMVQGFWPLVLVACRHHRLPVPPRFFFMAMPWLEEGTGPEFRTEPRALSRHLLLRSTGMSSARDLRERGLLPSSAGA